MDNDDLPDEIVQPLLQLGRALIRHARTHRDTSLAEHEDGVLAAWRRVSPALLESVLQVATTGLENTARPLASRCPRCQQRRGVQSQRKRLVQTRLGPIRLKRWWFGGERTEIVDWYHASEHVWTVAKALHGDDTPETKAWAKAVLDRLWQSGPKPLLNWFDATQPDTTAAASVLKREHGYFSTNAPRMQYPTLRQQQLPIGSGAVEASAQHLVQQRMKRAGSRWSDLSARGILDLRCHLLSGRSLDLYA